MRDEVLEHHPLAAQRRTRDAVPDDRTITPVASSVVSKSLDGDVAAAARVAVVAARVVDHVEPDVAGAREAQQPVGAAVEGEAGAAGELEAALPVAAVVGVVGVARAEGDAALGGVDRGRRSRPRT